MDHSAASVYEISEYSDDDTSHGEYIKDYPISTTTAETAFEEVLKYAGVSYARDSVDTRLVSDA